jgi:predicted transcriptional regulator
MKELLERIEAKWYKEAIKSDRKVKNVYSNLERIEKQVGIIRRTMDRQKQFPGKKDTMAAVEDSGSNAMMMIEFAKDVLNDIVEINKYNVSSR